METHALSRLMNQQSFEENFLISFFSPKSSCSSSGNLFELFIEKKFSYLSRKVFYEDIAIVPYVLASDRGQETTHNFTYPV